MNVLSLFSGIGGIDLGLERAGMTVVGQVEIDPWCRKVLAKHWPEVPRHDDVRTAADWWGGAARPVVDVVAGGFPCQPVSVAGKRLGQDDERWLWPAMWDTIRRLRPRYALMENVPGLLARGMGDVLGDLAAGGYDAEWDCVSASAVSAPHRRDRVWIIGRAMADPALMLGDGGDDHARGGREGGGPVPEPGDRRSAADVADAEGRRGQLRAALGERSRGSAGGGSLAHAEGQRRWPQRPVGAKEARPDALFGHAGERLRGLTWPAEPDVGRVAHGIPGRVDRLRGLGNAVVPQVVEHIGHMILDAAA